ncbi:MAG TPA: serine hydrolase [Candidatus Blautia faecavium]|uniref:Serine hydrolase n=1 Tax=Candidatus Blautia faecavium TaxID=2838487 RepID=A0A9D2RVD6_9FIRM|nr:serine hydrolase [Candidatus Blautia faecavium]
MELAARRRRRKKNNKTKLIICAIVEVIVILTLVVIIGWNKGVEDWFLSFQRPVVRNLDLSGINSPYAVLMQARGGKIIGEMGSEERIYPASMTKIMTAIVAIEELDDLEQEITLTSDMFAGLYEQDATQAGFQPDERVRAIDLLYGVMLPSGAECCIALADEIAGSEEAFVELMNKKAARLGMDDTNFRDTTGLHDPDHYSTVKDMAILLKYAIRNDTFREIIESHYHSTPPTNIHPDGITFYSTMFQSLSDTAVTGGEILGGKTGYTSDAGLCLASFAQVGDREYILVTAGAPGNTGSPLHVQDAVTIYNRLGEALEAAG